MDTDGLITSDRPVQLNWFGSKRPRRWAPGFGRADTIVSMTLSPRHVLVGAPMPVHSSHRRLCSDDAACINTAVAYGAERHVYYRGDGFLHLDRDGSIVEGPLGVVPPNSQSPWVESRRGTVGSGSSCFWLLSELRQCLNPTHSPWTRPPPDTPDMGISSIRRYQLTSGGRVMRPSYRPTLHQETR